MCKKLSSGMPSSDKEYWEAFYARAELTKEPSPFAKLCAKEYVGHGKVLFEAGCGNGRDALALSNAGSFVTAMDQCEQSITRLKLAHEGNSRLRFLSGDFVRHTYDAPLDAFYSRFTLHAIAADEERLLLEMVRKALSSGGLMLFEFRGLKNELNGVGRPVAGEPYMFELDGHRRRFIDTAELAKRLACSGMDILMCEEKSGFSPFQGKDETFARIIARAT